MSSAPTSTKHRWLFILAALVFLVPAAWGFVSKFAEFVSFVGQEEGAFTIVPIVNYVLVSLGFFFLLCWAVKQGMFRDLEKPKYTMLEQERTLDKETTHGNHGNEPA